MQSSHFAKAGLLALGIVLTFIFSWEGYLRHQGKTISYDDGPELWADKRAEVYQPQDKATVFIGSSRIKFDLDIPTWEKLTGDHAIQLAIEGNSPLPVLYNLADDKNFKGKMIVDVTEGLFFSSSPNNSPDNYIAYYKKETPAQKGSFQLNHLLESKFVFLDKSYFSLNAFLGTLALHDRPGVFALPNFPLEFNKKTFERQSYMSPEFVRDTNLQNKVKAIWVFFSKISKEKPPVGASLDSIFRKIKTAVDKIKARGGKVLFVRTPSSGPYLSAERQAFPRKEYWDKLLAVTQCPGIHFEDYPAIAHFQCPENSHLKPSDGVIFTKNFIQILQQKGWSFPHQLSHL